MTRPAGEDLDVLLTLVDCQITYRSRYLVGPLLAPVRDLVVLDPYNPRSVAFQVFALNDHIASLPTLKEGGLIERPHRLAVGLQVDADDGGSRSPRYQDRCLRWSRTCSISPMPSGRIIFRMGPMPAGPKS